MKFRKKSICICIVCLTALILIISITQIQAMINKTHKPLSGVVITLDAGHGGKDDGAQKEGVQEDTINLAITLQLKTKLEDAGAVIHLTRDGDFDLASDSVQNRKRDDMKKRVSIINEESNDLFISIHLNAFLNTSVHGAQAFYKKDDLASSTFAQIIQEQFNTFLNQKKKSKIGDYYILNETQKPGVLVECGYLSNHEERAKLQDKDYQEQIAEVLYQSVLSYLHVLDL